MRYTNFDPIRRKIVITFNLLVKGKFISVEEPVLKGQLVTYNIGRHCGWRRAKRLSSFAGKIY